MNRITKYYARLYESARKSKEEPKFWTTLRNDITQRNIAPRDLSIRGLFEEFVRDSHGAPCGREMIQSWIPDGREGFQVSHLSEAGVGAVTTAAFSNITGQIVYNEVMSAWNNPAFIAPRLMKTVDTSFLDGERIAGISSVGDDAEAIGETQDYPLTGITEAYVDMPRPIKRGHILPLTKEVVIADRTGVLMDRAESITLTMGMNKEKRVVDTILGVSNTWKRNGSAATTTYNDSTTAPHDFDNLLATNGLSDYTDIDNVMQAFDAMTDPETGEPIVIRAIQLLVPSSLLFTARRIVGATEIRSSTSNLETLSANPLNNPNFGGAQAASPFEILTSPYVQLRMTAGSVAANSWYAGDFMMAFRYMQVWPMTVQRQPANSDWEFQRDIIDSWKVSEFGVPGVVEPRYVIKCLVS